MGKGNDPNCGAGVTTMTVVSCDSPGGPEITDRELAQLAELDVAASDLAPRRALEALGAFVLREEPAAFKARTHAKTYSELRALVAEHCVDVDGAALDIERRWTTAAERGFVSGRPLPVPPTFHAHTLSKFGPGHLSGRLEDFTRVELRRTLGLRADDARSLSNDDLRAMAISEQLVPAYAGSPSHAQLATRFVALAYAGDDQNARLALFHKAMQAPYAHLADRVGVPTDGRRDPMQIKAELSALHPMVFAGSPFSYPPDMLDVARQLGVATVYDDAKRYRAKPGARSQLLSPWDEAFAEGMQRFAGRWNGCRLDGGICGPSSPRSIARKLVTGVPRRAVGFYGAKSGTINLSAQTEAILREARSGQAADHEVAYAADTLTHELFHAMGGGNGSDGGAGMYQPQGPPEHKTLEEGTAVLAAERHRESLARSLGLWRSTKPMPAPEQKMYPHERETVNAVAHMCVGKLQLSALRAGRYAQPGTWDPAALDLLERVHTRGRSYDERVQLLAEELAARGKRTPDQARQLIERMLQASPHSGAQIFTSERRALRSALAALIS